ncbi:hypothetical protein AUEXF2481DRAFT_109398 [Aureobasidium subglaciale EXF-2481]|uniref:STB6-like N-terminal domain-containing protein n=1 Tax=Aureobasidium subglaciale (strain EXF-2481) TaxID=1043005 RepID=A0A074Z5I4_AURSE|nr:uncharacterized protein AUEXF2481DRAFT_109398 [Aureobasidium subglaciale EXF-2481]KAI5208310.1 hypothetical protein E4T38_02829 [Aureobasidium subglaciale]KAI5227215.1 hypothetical protein E4T40_02731 [Aureobasidium subglaciale]KAI5230534.1 hypothetical protein E4T41_02828 [Aureobasidium subglaciale]KAI5264970.1 hypothetical protein E4T46_02606 [Aureobasidium subglaciale]KEQ94191.1 hypothetical protein AUEXF2481DRAFT_109398 [Aureobasidium subglaciale EXF-2481]
MSTPASATERPPGPHRQNVVLVTQIEESKNNDAEKHSPKPDSSKPPTHQRLVLTDPIAFRYLEEDPGVTVVERNQELPGYEIYVVEQWATSRTHPTFVITTFTGDPQHVAQVGILSVPTDESGWSQRLRVYFKALNQYHARRKETPLGILMITNLSGFPSSLNVIPVPDGDLKKHRFDYFVAENLKRMGCSGRVGLTLTAPNSATTAKFHQLYKTSDKNPIHTAVIELVKLCQAALNIFDKLDFDYVDGLLCDITEKAANDWWLDIGAEFYNMEPHDGILGPTTVAAMLGLLMGARNRLSAVGAPVPKDPFDVEGMKRGISHFQKSQRLERTRRLDRHTLDRLHRISAKAASAEGWSVPRAVKSTVAELSGKGGEMLAEVVGRRDKAGIADIETSYIDRFEQLVYGQRCKWLWLGKPLKNQSVDLKEHRAEEYDRLFGRIERKHTQESVTTARGMSDDVISPTWPSSRDGEGSIKEETHLHRSVTKRATGLFNDGRRGFGKFKDAVRGHHPKGSKDDSPLSPTDSSAQDFKSPHALHRINSTSPPASPKVQQEANGNLDQVLEQREYRQKLERIGRNDAQYSDNLFNSPLNTNDSVFPVEDPQRKSEDARAEQNGDKSDNDTDIDMFDTISRTISGAPSISIAGSDYHGYDLKQVLPQPSDLAQDIGPLLRNIRSYSDFETLNFSSRSDSFYPRRLSYSIAESSILPSTTQLLAPSSPLPHTSLESQFEHETTISSDLKALRAEIATLDRKEGTWTRQQLLATHDLLTQADEDQSYLDSIYRPSAANLQDLRDASDALVIDERDALHEGAKELETLAARLEYEVEGLRGKVEDVEVNVGDFERAVGGIEGRIGELEDMGHGKGCIVC